jgi:hypothetical protein
MSRDVKVKEVTTKELKSNLIKDAKVQQINIVQL